MWQPGWELAFGGERIHVYCIRVYCMAESLHRSPETITILLINYTTIENKKFNIFLKICILKDKSHPQPEGELRPIGGKLNFPCHSHPQGTLC